jgi:uncharacterized protein (DUF433 family)
MQWSYRDLVFLRLLLWFRQRGMDRPEAAERTRECRRLIKSGVVDATAVRSDGHGMILEGDDWDRMTGETVWALAAEAMEQHDLLEPIKGESDRPIFQPNLQRPSARTAVSPWVLAGEPVVRDTRVPTVSLWALQKQRALRPADIVRLYPGLTTDDVEDATDLERRLRLRAA